LAAVGEAFVAAKLPDPRYEQNGKMVKLLQRQLEGYKNEDPGVKHQKSLSIAVIIAFVGRITSCTLTQVIQDLILLAFFLHHAHTFM
jgi:hypothetical protein